MRYPFLLVVSLLLFPACSKPTVSDREPDPASIQPSASESVVAVSDDVVAELEAAQSKATKYQVAANEALAKAERAESELKTWNEIAAADAKKDARANEAHELFVALNKECNVAVKEWRTSMRTAKTREERDAIFEKNPNKEFANKYIEFSEKFSDTADSHLALSAAVSKGAGEGKEAAMCKLLEIVDESNRESLLAKSDIPQSEEDLQDWASEIYMTIAKNGSGDSQATAIEKLLDSVKENLDSTKSIEALTSLASLRGDVKKGRIFEMLFKIAEEDALSNKACDCLATIFKSADNKVKSAAGGLLLENHLNSDRMLDILKSMERMEPSESAENFLKTVCQKATNGKVKGHAIITLSKFIGTRKSFAGFLKNATEEQLEPYDEELISYVTKENDPGESAEIESMLEEFLDDRESMLEGLKAELYVLQNLSVGKTAPDIAAADLDGVEFKLSDYRGKIVFLDFWGDW